MFRKFTHFSYKGPMYREKKIAHEQDLEYQQQIVFCGSRGKEVLEKMDINVSAPGTEDEMFAIRYTMNGQLKFTGKAIDHSLVDYDEKRKREYKHKECTVAFKHEDNFSFEFGMSGGRSDNYQAGKVDFTADEDIVIVLACSDKEEENRLVARLAELAGNRKNIYFMVARVPEVVGAPTSYCNSWYIPINTTSIGGNRPHTYCIYHDDGYAKSYAKFVDSKVKEIAEAFHKRMVSDAKEQIKQEVVSEMAKDLHSQANEHFAKPFYKR